MAATLADVREKIFSWIEGDPNRRFSNASDYFVSNLLPIVARGATDADLLRWLAKLDPVYEIRGLALAAIERERAGQPESARTMLRLAESKSNPADVLQLTFAVEALISAHWRLGDRARADEMYEGLLAQRKRVGTLGAWERLVSAAAMGHRADLVESLLPLAFAHGSQGASRVVPGLVAALEDGQDAIADAILTRMSEKIRLAVWIEPLRTAMARVTVARPRRMIDATLRWPRVMDCADAIPLALAELERRNPGEAVEAAVHVLEEPRAADQAGALAILNTHAPAIAAEWMASDEERERPPTVARLAALGRDAECREAMAREGSRQLRDAIHHAVDPELAVQLARATADRARHDESWEDLAVACVALAELGDGGWLDAHLAARADAMRADPAGAGSQRSTLVRAAALAGRTGLARSVVDSEEPDARLAGVARVLIAAAAEVGDYDAASSALELVPAEGVDGRLATALRDLLQVALLAPALGLRAVPLRARGVGYVRSAIARGDRARVEWILMASKGTLPPDAQVEIDRFLERA